MKVAVLGAGAMGTGIGQIAAQNSCQVVYYDSFLEAIEQSKSSIESIFARFVEKGRMSESDKASTLAKMTWSKNIHAIKGADIVIEAVIENIEVKK
ncbi:MAG: 3-hydroxyacyl-CoA dehydrogenase NAD-binding domain-containing protein, partial [Bacteroidota bacterium]|nr:3-hydroxyacyl-CoA dehydrogenase NAD-binding domain-containing protein [Bacteroidota bacterium]